MNKTKVKDLHKFTVEFKELTEDLTNVQFISWKNKKESETLNWLHLYVKNLQKYTNSNCVKEVEHIFSEFKEILKEAHACIQEADRTSRAVMFRTVCHTNMYNSIMEVQLLFMKTYKNSFYDLIKLIETDFENLE